MKTPTTSHMNVYARLSGRTANRMSMLTCWVAAFCLITAALGCGAPATAPAPVEAPVAAPVEAPPAPPAPVTPPAEPAAAAPLEAPAEWQTLPQDATYSRGVGTATATALDDYVYKPDPAFKYVKLATKEDPNSTTTIYHLNSQTWLDETQVDRPLWEHIVTITVPKEVKFTKAMMFISGGGNSKDMDTNDIDVGPLGVIAVMTKSIVCQIKQIPNQSIRFVGETDDRYKEEGRKEDALIGFGWDKFLSGGDSIWLARLPMTKAVVRAMDVAQKEVPTIDGFFVAGGSKRGWTTWTTAAVDKRVIGIAPAVIDVLNVEASLQNHFDAYGFWAPAISEYVDAKVTDRIHTPEFKKLMNIVDPLAYRDRLTMPKYIINSSGDQFFAPNSWQFYFNELQGEKNLCYVPNTDHGLNTSAYMRLASFYLSVISGTPRPNYTWERAEDGSLRVKCETKPEKVTLWQAYNPDARDFRKEAVGEIYTESPLTETEPGVYVSNVAPAEKGWTAFFIEVQFPNPGAPAPFVFTTGISILPDTFPGKK